MSSNEMVTGKDLNTFVDREKTTDEMIQQDLSNKSIDEVKSLIESIIADKSVKKKVRRDAVGRVVDNQPHPAREFEQFKLWNGSMRSEEGVDNDVRVVTMMLSISFFLAPLLGITAYLESYPVWSTLLVTAIPVVVFGGLAYLDSGADYLYFRRKIEHKRHDLTLEDFNEKQYQKKVDRARVKYEEQQAEMKLLGISEEGGSMVSVAEVKQEFKDAQARIASYALDMTKALSRPAFNDVTVPQVSEMVLQLKKCQRMVNEISASSASDVAGAVDELWVKIDSAEVTAKRIAWSKVSEDEQKNLRIALDLVKQANDPGNPDELRRNLYSRLKRVVARLDEGGVTIPAKMTEQIESKVRSELSPLADNVNMETTKKEETVV